ncbi:MAG: DUF5916 domain-containing protein, partial [Acidobacteriota bacterium]
YSNDTPNKRTRDRQIWVAKYQNWNYDGDLVANGIYGSAYATLTNYWYAYTSGGKSWPTFDDRKTRGGPVAARPGDHDISVGFGSDSRKKFWLEVNGGIWNSDDGGNNKWGNVNLRYRPRPNLSLSIVPSYSVEHDATQYVTALPGTQRVFSQLDQHSFDIGTRIDWTISSRLSFQLYTQPLIATGDYHDFTQLAQARTADYTAVDFNGNPDFNFRSVRGSGVVRWEFRPGSAVYFVWNENRADTLSQGNFRLRQDLAGIRNAPSQDVFLIKVSYWIPM